MRSALRKAFPRRKMKPLKRMKSLKCMKRLTRRKRLKRMAHGILSAQVTRPAETADAAVAVARFALLC